MQLIQQIFAPVDAEVICKIKTSPRQEDDLLAWHYEKRGMFTVKSAYHLAVELSASTEQQSTSARPDGGRAAWAAIWKCQVPQKVRIFAWEAASKSHAIRQK